jgi:hypothetical protein
MWDAAIDLDKPGARDLPCNTQIYFQRDVVGKLDMMVTNRSNDLLWGMLGANVVHFSMLQEYMAARIGCEVGRYWQVSFNLHAYKKVLESSRALELIQFAPQERGDSDRDDPYANALVTPGPLVENATTFDAEANLFVTSSGGVLGMKERFFRRVAVPAIRAHKAHRDGDRAGAFAAAQQIEATDWRKACVEWLERRDR